MHFFIYSSLPAIDFTCKPDISNDDFMSLLNLNLSKRQMKKVNTLKLWIDIYNVHASLLSDSFDDRGNFSKSFLYKLLFEKEIIVEKVPDYILEFLYKYDNEEDRKKNIGWLISQYFKNEIKNSSGFLKEFLTFEYRWRVLIAGYRCKKIGRDLIRELQFENMDDPIVEYVLAQSGGASSFVFPFEYKNLEISLIDAGPNPSKQYEALAKFRFDFYLKYILNYQFTFCAVTAFMMNLWILEEHYALKQDVGEEELYNLVEKDYVS